MLCVWFTPMKYEMLAFNKRFTNLPTQMPTMGEKKLTFSNFPLYEQALRGPKYHLMKKNEGYICAYFEVYYYFMKCISYCIM